MHADSAPLCGVWLVWEFRAEHRAQSDCRGLLNATFGNAVAPWLQEMRLANAGEVLGDVRSKQSVTPRARFVSSSTAGLNEVGVASESSESMVNRESISSASAV